MTYHFRNLVFEGGGVKGLAYAGALKVLERKGILRNIRRVGGTSAGAINSVLLALNYSPDQTARILAELDFKLFMDDSWGLLRDADRLVTKFGWYKGDFFRDWIGKLIKKKTGNSEATFLEVQSQAEDHGFRELFVVGTNLSTGYAEVFSHEHTPRDCVADAVRISMSIPLFFAAKRSPRGDVYVDGGMLDNYPVKLFDREKYVEKHSLVPEYYRKHNTRLRRQGKEISPYCYNQETLGFRLDSAEEIAVFRDQAEPPHRDIDDFFDYTWALIRTAMGFQSSLHLHSDDWMRTVYIDTLGVGTTDFGLSDAKKQSLIASGERHAEAYFAWYDDKKSDPAPANRPV